MFINYKIKLVWRGIPLAAGGTRRNIPSLQATALEPCTKASPPLACKASVEIHIPGLVQNLQPKWELVTSTISNVDHPIYSQCQAVGHVGYCTASSLQNQPPSIHRASRAFPLFIHWREKTFFPSWGHVRVPVIDHLDRKRTWQGEKQSQTTAIDADFNFASKKKNSNSSFPEKGTGVTMVTAVKM